MIGFGPTASADNLFADQRGTRPGRSCERLQKCFLRRSASLRPA